MKSDLREIPGVGIKMEASLQKLGYTTIASLKNADPEEMYEKDALLHGEKRDACVLYVYRLAVYYASTEEKKREPEKLKWWNWK
ncbi:MAG: helix-hairpin-helix domain-containing protein [Christensenellaceae bacterium]|jgi:hypothetical protein